MHPSCISRVLLLAVLVLGLGLDACATYRAPPRPTLSGLQEGLLPDANAPLMVTFDAEVDPKTLKVRIARFVTDIEGNLGDEDEDTGTSLDPLFIHDPDEGDFGGVGELMSGNRVLRITPKATLPIGARLVLLVEPGLSDPEGNVQLVRKRILFSYEFKLNCNKPTKVVESGTYFWLFEVKKPIATQVQLWTIIKVDPATGAFIGQFTNADRNADPKRCPTPCKSTEACRLLPAPACVIPSEKAGSVDEYSDYLPNDVPPTGYSFTGRGCIEDQPDGSAAFVNVPLDMVVQQPAVTLRAAKMTASFTKDTAGVTRGTGTIFAGEVLLGGGDDLHKPISSGTAEGSLSARWVDAKDVPAGVPPPPAK